MSPPESLSLTANAVRSFLEPIWSEWHAAWGNEMPDPPSRWTCCRSSLMLKCVFLEDFGIKADWISGTPRLTLEGPELGPYGFFTGQTWESHAWVRCENTIIDITADQFGAAPITITDVNDKRYSPGSGDTAMADYVDKRQQTIEAIWPLWLASPARKAVFRKV